MTPKNHSMTRRDHLAFGFVLALIVGTAMGIGSGGWVGVAGFAIVFGWVVVTCLLPKDRFELMRVGGLQDERQSQLGMEAMALSGAATLLFALGGFVWDAAHDHFGAFGWTCAVAGVSFLLAQLLLPRRR